MKRYEPHLISMGKCFSFKNIDTSGPPFPRSKRWPGQQVGMASGTPLLPSRTVDAVEAPPSLSVFPYRSTGELP